MAIWFKCKLHVRAWGLSWGLNVDHWLVAVIVSLSAVLSLCFGRAHTASCTTHVFDQVFCPFLIHSALVFTPLWGYKGCFVIDCLKTSGRCCMNMLFPFCFWVCFFTWMYDLFSLMLVLECKRWIFEGCLGLNVLLFCFWSVAKCLPNTVCAQQWIKKGPLF